MTKIVQFVDYAPDGSVREIETVGEFLQLVPELKWSDKDHSVVYVYYLEDNGNVEKLRLSEYIKIVDSEVM